MDYKDPYKVKGYHLIFSKALEFEEFDPTSDSIMEAFITQLKLNPNTNTTSRLVSSRNEVGGNLQLLGCSVSKLIEVSDGQDQNQAR